MVIRTLLYINIVINITASLFNTLVLVLVYKLILYMMIQYSIRQSNLLQYNLVYYKLMQYKLEHREIDRDNNPNNNRDLRDNNSIYLVYLNRELHK